MFWTFRFHAAKNFLEVVFEGESSIEDGLTAKEQYLADPNWRPGMNLLIDCRKARINPTPLDDLRLAAQFHMDRQWEFGDGRIAYLVKPGYDFGVARQLVSVMDFYTTNEAKPFIKKVEAIKWMTEEPKRIDAAVGRSMTLILQDLLNLYLVSSGTLKIP